MGVQASKPQPKSLHNHNHKEVLTPRTMFGCVILHHRLLTREQPPLVTDSRIFIKNGIETGNGKRKEISLQ